MMHNFKTICLSALLLMTGVVSVSAQDLKKFELTIRGYDKNETPVDVKTTVWEDYKFCVAMPSKNACTLNSSKATVTADMQQVGSLGVEKRHYENTIETGYTSIEVQLDKFLSYIYSFGGATSPVTVIDTDGQYANFVYKIEGINSNYEIIGTPDDSKAAARAWSIIARNNVESTINPNNDSFIGIKEGSYLRFGNEDLVFGKNVNLIQGKINFSDFIKAVKEESNHVVNNGLTGDDAKVFVLHIKAGSQLDLGSSLATLKNDVTITMDLRNYKESLSFDKVLSYMAEHTNSTADAIQTTLAVFNNLIKMVDDAENVPITVVFGPQGKVLLGDLNGDAVIDVQDVTLMVDIILRRPGHVNPILYGASGKKYNIGNVIGEGAWINDEEDYGISVEDVTPLVDMALGSPYKWIEIK